MKPATALENILAPRVAEPDAMQTEFWVEKGRKAGAWVPQHLMAGVVTNGYVPWRKVKLGHTHKDKLPHSIATVKGGYSRTRTEVCDAYVAWAKAKCLTRITTYKGDHISNFAARGYGSLRNEVDVAEFIGPAPAPEPLEYVSVRAGLADLDHEGLPLGYREGVQP